MGVWSFCWELKTEQTADPAGQDRLLILGEAAASITNQICPKSAHFGSRTGGLGTGLNHQQLQLGAQLSPRQTPPDLSQQHLSPQFIKKQLMATPPAQVLRCLSLPPDCRAVISLSNEVSIAGILPLTISPHQTKPLPQFMVPT